MEKKNKNKIKWKGKNKIESIVHNLDTCSFYTKRVRVAYELEL